MDTGTSAQSGGLQVVNGHVLFLLPLPTLITEDEDPGAQTLNSTRRPSTAFLSTSSHTFTSRQWFKNLQWFSVTARVSSRFLTLYSAFAPLITPQHKPFCIQTKVLCVQDHFLTVYIYPNLFLSFQYSPSCQRCLFLVHLQPTLEDSIEDLHNSTPH